MPADSVDVVESPRWWLGHLSHRLQSRRAEMDRMNRYYSGDHPLPFLTQTQDAKMHDEFRKLIDDSRSNFMRLVVDASEERLRVEGFRLSAKTDPTADSDSWDIWQANAMDANSQAAFVEAMVKGVSYLSVWSDDDGDGYPDICVEDPTQTIVGYVPGSNFRRRAAALKIWRDDWTGKDRANVYLPEGIWKYEADSTLSPDRVPTQLQEEARDVSWTEFKSEPFVPNPVPGVIPIVPIRNRPRLLLEGESEISDVFRIQNQINGFLFLLALAGYFGAHKQRWAIGLNIMEDKNGRPVDPIAIGVDKLIVAQNPNAKFGEFTQTTLDGYISAIEQKVKHIAVTTRTPRHYLEQSGQSPSGDAIKSAESGLVKKVERKQGPFGEGLEEAVRLARRFGGSKSPAQPDAPVDSEIVWTDASTPTVAETTDAVIKRFLAGLSSWTQAMSDLGYTQTEIERIRAMRVTDGDLNLPPAASASAGVRG